MAVLAVEARGLTKSFGGGRPPALAGLDLEVPAGTVFGLIGQNGAGKTTFIKALLAVLRPSGGTVRVFGEAPERPAVRRRIGYLPERQWFSPGQTAAGFLWSVGRVRGLERWQLGAEVERQLGRVGLSEVAGVRAHKLSKGMKQRLGLAGALLGGPELLVLDEPTDGIDPLGRADVRAILLEERRRGATVFLNSHLLAETERIADQIGILHAGRMIKSGALKDLARAEGQWLLKLEAPDETKLRAEGLVPDGEGGFIIEASDPVALNARLDRLRAAGQVLVELRPRLHDLEDLLREVVGR
ncbi:MAG: ABC transporter ATP-binding protein [Myxococcota bacterium]